MSKKTLYILGASTLAGMFLTAAALRLVTAPEYETGTLSPRAETIRAEIAARLKKNSVYGELDSGDECAAFHIARYQADREIKRAEFLATPPAGEEEEKDVARVIALDRQREFAYALNAFMLCRNGQEPQPF